MTTLILEIHVEPCLPHRERPVFTGGCAPLQRDLEGLMKGVATDSLNRVARRRRYSGA